VCSSPEKRRRLAKYYSKTPKQVIGSEEEKKKIDWDQGQYRGKGSELRLPPEFRMVKENPPEGRWLHLAKGSREGGDSAEGGNGVRNDTRVIRSGDVVKVEDSPGK